MDPPSIVKSFKYSSTPQQQPQTMFSVSVEPPLPLHYRSSSSPHNNSSQDASFSSYLKSNDPNSQKPQENVVDDTEISIFDAQKYFSENSDHKEMKKPQAPEPHDDTLSSVDGCGRNFRTRSFHATPTASSEASWNSQTGLLANPPGSVGVSLRNFNSDDKRRSSAARKWMFGRKCCCTGKKSVEVKEATTSDSEHGGPVIINNNVKSNFLHAKRDSYKSKQSSTTTITTMPMPMPMSMSMSTSLQRSSITNDKVAAAPNSNSFPSPDPDPPRQQRISASGVVGGFSFPILNNSNQNQQSRKGIITKPPINIINPLEDPPRDSLEVFQPMHEVPPRFNPPGSMDDDVASDASSDLFEIESFSTQTTSYPMYRRRDSLDEAPTFNVRRFAAANGINLNNNSTNIQYGRTSLDEPPTPSVAATECYAPSEVSIDWSVTTAEGFDRASVSNFSVSASEIGSTALLRQRLQEEALGKKKGNGGGGGGLLLMSCRQEKAVSVGPQPVKCEGGALMVFPAHAGGRPPRANKPAMGSDHSARLSLAFAA